MDFPAKNETMILFLWKKLLCARNRIDAISLFFAYLRESSE